MASTTLVTTNSLSEQLSNIQLSQANIVRLLQAFQDAIVTRKEFVEVELDDSSGGKVKYQIPSNSFLYGEVKALLERNQMMDDILSGNRAFLVNEDGSYREVLASSFKQTVSNDLSALTYSNVVRVDQSSLIQDMIHPSTKLIFTLPKEYKYVERINVKAFKIDNDAQFALFNNQDELQRVYSVIRNNSVTYSEFNTIYPTDVRRVRYYGDFNVLSVTYNQDTTQTLRLQSLNYSDSSSIAGTRELTTGDVLTNQAGDSRFQVISVSTAEKQIIVNRIFGAGSIAPGETGCSYYDSTNLDDLRTFGLPIQGNQKLLVFISGVNPTNDVATAYSKCYKIDTTTLTVVDNDTEFSFNTYFANRILNIGEYLRQLISESNIPYSLGVKPEKPTIDASFFQVVQINQHMSDNADVQKLNKLNQQKTSVYNEIASLTERIGDVKARINAGSYNSTRDREVDVQELDRLTSEKTKKSSLYESLVRDISSKLTSDQLEEIAPKFRIRGFWPIQTAITSPNTRVQRIIRYVVNYRYLATTGEAAKASSFKYTDASGNQIIGTFSSWNEDVSKTLRKIQKADGTFDWDNPISENADEININQLDVPIQPGESVEIRIKACSEAGYPVTFMESDWSDIIRIDFPADMLGIADLNKSLANNSADLQKVELDAKLRDEGITEHISGSYKEGSKYFGHSAHEVASGFFTNEQTTISLYEYLTGMVGRIVSLEDRLARRATAAKLEILDGNTLHTITRFSTLRLFAGYYTSNVDISDAANYGKIAEAKFYLKISNTSSSVIEMLSPSPGNLSQDTNNALYSPVAISVPASGLTAKQKFGQIVYLRAKDMTSVTPLYTNNFTPSNSIIGPADIDGTAPAAERDVFYYDGANVQKVKTNAILTLNDWIAVHKTNPIAAAYDANQSSTNRTALINELTRVQRYNAVLKSLDLQHEYNANMSTEFTPNDQYMVGSNSCGARMFMRLASMQYVQVTGSDNASYKEVQPGEANAILIPIVFQFRMMDALGHVNGLTTTSVNDNFDYVKKVGIDLTVGGDLFKFDLEVVAKFRPTTISSADLPINVLDQIKKAVQSQTSNPTVG